MSLSHRHCISIDDFSPEDIVALLDKGDFYTQARRDKKDVTQTLNNKILITLFFEDSTRTRTSFEMAAKRLGAEIINIDVTTSSLNKGESFQDTITTLNAIEPDALIVRHHEYGGPKVISTLMDCPVINAGDSWNEHPTQALLDALTLRQHFGTLEGLKISIIGDIAHSRVASSNMKLLTKMGTEVTIIAPPVLMPQKLPSDKIKTATDLEEGLKDADAIMTIRPQKERMASALIEDQSYFKDYGLTKEKLALTGKDSVILDPGPFLRNVQISDALADSSPAFLYHKQVTNGVAMRMAIIDSLIRGGA